MQFHIFTNATKKKKWNLRRDIFLTPGINIYCNELHNILCIYIFLHIIYNSVHFYIFEIRKCIMHDHRKCINICSLAVASLRVSVYPSIDALDAMELQNN